LFLGTERSAFDGDELLRLQLEHRPIEAVRRDADEMFPLLPLAVSEIIRHLAFDVGPFAVEVALGLEDGAADEGVQSAAHFGYAALEF
jgi:hypothetical protein